MSPLVRIDLVAGNGEEAIVMGTTDGGSVRVAFRTSEVVGRLLAATATAVGPFWVEVPDEAIGMIQEIDPSAPEG